MAWTRCVLADSVHVSSWIVLFTAELQLHIFPFQLLCMEYSPKTTILLLRD